MIKISLKDTSYRKDDNILFCQNLETGKYIQDAQYLYVDGPCKSLYEVDPKIANYRIVWLETDAPFYKIKENEKKKFRKKITIDKNAISNNCVFQRDKKYHLFHKVCSLYEDDKLIEKSLSFEILGPCQIIHEPSRTDCRAWIETDSEVRMINEVIGE